MDGIDIFHRPGCETADWPLQRTAELRQFIIDARRHRRGNSAADQPIALEIAKGKRENALRHAGDFAAKLVESLRSFTERLHYEHSPLVTNPGQQGADRPAYGIAGVLHRLPRCSRLTNLFVHHKKVRSCEPFLCGYLRCLG